MTRDEYDAQRRRQKTINGLVSDMRVAQLDARGIYRGDNCIPDQPIVTYLPTHFPGGRL